METFETSFWINNKEYKATIEGSYTPAENSLEAPWSKADFDVVKVFITPDSVLGEIDLMKEEYAWLITPELLNEFKKDFFNNLKGNDYE
jgi:hypothetical protein